MSQPGEGHSEAAGPAISDREDLTGSLTEQRGRVSRLREAGAADYEIRPAVKGLESLLRSVILEQGARLPTINKPAVKIEPHPPGSFYDDDDLKGMDLRLANMSYYFGNSQKLREDINEVKLRKSFETAYFYLEYFHSLNQYFSPPTRSGGARSGPC